MDPPGRAESTAFVAHHQRGILRWLAALGCDPHAAEEHCQDALLAGLHHGIHGLPAADAARWLRTAARNFHWMRLRQQGRRPDTVSLDEVEAAWHRIGGDDDGGDGALAALRGCLAAATADDRRLLQLRYADGASRGAMAAALGIGEAGVKQALRRARARLTVCMETKLGRKRQDGREQAAEERR